MQEWVVKEVNISEIQDLLNDYDVEIDSPDGFVPVLEFVEKGLHQEHIVSTDEHIVRCSWDHMFETESGWKYARDISNDRILTPTGFQTSRLSITGTQIPIVDLVIGHENHRYYANGLSSHNTNVGKSLIMCHLAAAYMMSGLNVLYITMEMAEERISERIDANLLNIDLDILMDVDKTTFMKKVEHIRAKTVGKLKVVEYPTASAGAANFRHLLNELRLKQNFTPDVIFIDYINICTSSRIKNNGNANTFVIVKSIAEELRGLAVEFNLPIWSATQTTRSGMTSSDLDLGDVSESIALASTCDFMIGVTQSEEMAALAQYMFKQIKSRYGDKNKYRRFVVGVDMGKMRLFDIDQSEATTADKPIMDNTEFGTQDFERRKPRNKFKGAFQEFK